jgi:hypothetical protein
MDRRKTRQDDVCLDKQVWRQAERLVHRMLAMTATHDAELDCSDPLLTDTTKLFFPADRVVTYNFVHHLS